MKKRGMDLTLLDEVVDKLRQGITLDEKYKDHILKGEYAGFHECHIKPDWLLIYLIDNDMMVGSKPRFPKKSCALYAGN